MDVIFKGINNTRGIIRLIEAFFPHEEVDIVDNISKQGEILVIDVQEKDILIKLLNNNNLIKYFNQNMSIYLLEKERILLIKQLIYNILSSYMQTQLPWGILTGVRPVKIALNYIEQQISEKEIKDIMRNKYLIQEDKIDTMIKIASFEHKICNKFSHNEYSLYIGIPFCPTRCSYCSFTAFPIKDESYVNYYLNALIKEIKYISQKMKKYTLKTIYIGGGTPTSLSCNGLERLLYEIINSFDISNLEEWTVEAGRPDSIDKEKLSIMKSSLITRISINPQSMNQKTLDLIGRKHTVKQTVDCYMDARELGFDNINMDIILGLPEEGRQELINTLNQIRELNPDSLTVHALAIKRASQLKDNNYHNTNINKKDINKMQQLTYEYANENKLNPYYLYRQKNIAGNLENIGFAKVGKESIYNILIMEEKQTIIAAGAGGISKIKPPNDNKIQRIENVKNIEEYVSRIENMIERKRKVLDKIYYTK